jgi:hypothetical protein
MEYVGNELKLVRGGSLKTSDNATYQDVLSAAKKVKHLTRRFLVERGVMYLHTLIQVFNSGYQR